MRIQFQPILDEMETFIYDKVGKPIHMQGKHDDLIFALGMTIQGDRDCPKHYDMELPERTGDMELPRAKTDLDLAVVGAVDDFDDDDFDEDEWYFTA